MRKTPNFLIAFLLVAYSPERSATPPDINDHSALKPRVIGNALSKDPALDPYPQTKPDGSPLDEAYCTRVGNEPDGPFDNSKVCYMIACKRGDAASCEMANSYNGNLVQDDKPQNPDRLEGMDYFSARKIILGYGWQPMRGPCEGGGTGEATCNAFPEIRYCQGTGIAFCDMEFTRKGRCLVVVTTGGAPGGDGPGDTHVRDVRFRSESCWKIVE